MKCRALLWGLALKETLLLNQRSLTKFCLFIVNLFATKAFCVAVISSLFKAFPFKNCGAKGGRRRAGGAHNTDALLMKLSLVLCTALPIGTRGSNQSPHTQYSVHSIWVSYLPTPPSHNMFYSLDMRYTNQNTTTVNVISWMEPGASLQAQCSRTGSNPWQLSSINFSWSFPICLSKK